MLATVALKLTPLLPSNDTAFAVISPLISKFFEAAKFVAVAALPVISLEVRAIVPVALGKVNVLSAPKLSKLKNPS